MKSKFALFAVLLSLAFSMAEASEVLQVKGSKVLLNIGDLPVSQGSEVFAVNAEGKKKAILVIRQIRNDKAVAELTKGVVEPGMSLKVRGTGAAVQSAAPPAPVTEETTEPLPAPQESPRENKASSDRAQRPRGFWGQFLKRGTGVGLMAGLAQNDMSLTSKQNGASEDLSLKGNSYNVVGFYDYDLSKTFTVRGVSGLESFNVSGSSTAAVCNGGTSCSASFNYLSGEAHLHYNFMQGSTRAWAGAGFMFLLTVSKSSTITSLDTSNATNQMFLIEGGADFSLGKGNFVPVSFEYGMFPGGGNVTAKTMILRAGYGWRF